MSLNYLIPTVLSAAGITSFIIMSRQMVIDATPVQNVRTLEGVYVNSDHLLYIGLRDSVYEVVRYTISAKTGKVLSTSASAVDRKRLMLNDTSMTLSDDGTTMTFEGVAYMRTSKTVGEYMA